MTIDEAKAWLAHHPARQPVRRIACPAHSTYAEVDVRATFERVRNRVRQPPIPVQRVRDAGLSTVIRTEPRGQEQATIRSMGVEGPSFIDAAEEVRRRLRMVHRKAAAA